MGNLDYSSILEELACLSLLFINDRSKCVMDEGAVAKKPWQIEERPLTRRAWPVIYPHPRHTHTHITQGWMLLVAIQILLILRV